MFCSLIAFIQARKAAKQREKEQRLKEKEEKKQEREEAKRKREEGKQQKEYEKTKNRLVQDVARSLKPGECLKVSITTRSTNLCCATF